MSLGEKEGAGGILLQIVLVKQFRIDLLITYNSDWKTPTNP